MPVLAPLVEGDPAVRSSPVTATTWPASVSSCPGSSQLLVYHFMFGPEHPGGCPSCSAIADGFNGFAMHLEHHDVGMIAVARAPIAALQAYKRRMGWTFPWASSLDSDFNFDFNTSFTENQQRSGTIDYNYRPKARRGPGTAGF